MTGIYIGADGKARKIKGAYVGIDGVARKIKKGYIGDENGKARLCWNSFEPDPVFENNSWENIALACKLNEVPDTWAVGDKKAMTIGEWDYEVNIIGKNHDDYADGSGKAPLTFQMYELYGSLYQMNSENTSIGGWTESEMRTIHLPAIMQLMPSEVQKGIREVVKSTSAGNASSNIVTTNDKLFLIAEIEILGEIAISREGEGTQYEYYANGGSMRKNLAGIEKTWWTRSPTGISVNKFGYAINDRVGSANAHYEHAVAFAFCF